MTRRKEHLIESNCVSFDDDCWNETQGQENYRTIYNYETEILKEAAKKLYKTGEEFVKDLEIKLGLKQ